MTARFVLILGVALVLTAIVARQTSTSGAAWVRTFMLVFGSLAISGLPFVAIGAVAAAAVSVLVPPSALERIGELPRPLQLPAAALAGIALPICECGSVPLARRLMQRGVAPPAALTFMLAAPIVNPVVAMSTYVAYRGRGPALAMVGGRFILGFVAAIAVGWFAGNRGLRILRSHKSSTPDVVGFGRPEGRSRRFFVHMAEDFTFMARYLLIGASVAAAVQTFFPQRVIGSIGGIPVIEALTMMAIAAILSLCSESDAFIAASFGQLGIGLSAQLAFLVFGPMVDMKLGAMYLGTFTSRTAFRIMLGAAVVALVGSMWMRVVTG